MRDDLCALVESERERFGVPGCAVVVVAGGRTVLCDGFGARDVESDRPVTPQTLFPIASSTKTFTAALCASLVQDGVLDWHRPVRDYLAGFAMCDPVAGAGVSLYDMLCHRSGLPRHDLLWYADGGEMSRTDLVHALEHLEANRSFRQSFQYNNLLYLVAGEVASHADGGSYEAALRRRLLDPLGMARTNVSVDDLIDSDDVATPYVFSGPDETRKTVPYARLDLIAPAGAINSCAADMTSWLYSLLGHGVGDAAPLLGPGALSALMTPAVPLPAGSTLVAGDAVGYCLGMMAMDHRGLRVLQHGGNIDGFSSQVTVVPGEDCGVVVLTNRDGTSLRDALPLMLIESVLGMSPKHHGTEMLEVERAMRRGRNSVMHRESGEFSHLGPVRPMTDYVGRYRHPSYGDIEIDLVEDNLTARHRRLVGVLEHRHLEVFDLVVDLGGTQTPIAAQFLHALDGHVSSLRVVLEEAVAPIVFERVPDTTHLSDEVLDELAGTYRLGPLTTVVERRGRTGLTIVVVEGAPRSLRPLHGLVFALDEVRIEFSGDGVVSTSAGDFVRE